MSFSPEERAECERLLRWGLDEDLGETGDITSQALLDPKAEGSALVVARKGGVVAGLAILEILADSYDQGLETNVLVQDGPVIEGTELARLSGPVRSILAVERLALNLLGQLSGTATLTANFVRAIQGTSSKIYDTRKTIPGWRYLQKYAVRIGGGTNHRTGLYDGVLIKDNHLAALAKTEKLPIGMAVRRAREAVGEGMFVGVEVDSLTQIEQALTAQPDLVLLDNMTPENLGVAVEMRSLLAPEVQLEASGGISLENVVAVARSGVDRISIGALTHSAPALDLALDYQDT